VLENLKRAGLRPPKTLTVAITGTCNLKCTHCLVEAGPQAATRHVPAEKVVGLASDLAALGGEGIVLTGGEPLAHPRWRDILRTCCSQPGLKKVGLQTNGALLGQRQVEALRALAFEGLSIQISLDGSSPATHDLVRGPGTFVRTLEGIRRLQAAGLAGRVTIAFTEMEHNMGDIPALLELVDGLGLRALVGGTLVEDGRAAETGVAPPTPEQYRDLLDRFHADTHFQELYGRYGKIAAIEWWKGRFSPASGCCTFVENPYVTADGNIYPCALCHAPEFVVGGAHDKPLREVLLDGVPVWAGLLEVSRARPDQLAACQGCVGKLHCAGGCMGRAQAACGTFLAVEDRCEQRKAVYEWKEKDK
jgi:radical SAM protein with 4Fe4S-binding SPASM domain